MLLFHKLVFFSVFSFRSCSLGFEAARFFVHTALSLQSFAAPNLCANICSTIAAGIVAPASRCYKASRDEELRQLC